MIFFFFQYDVSKHCVYTCMQNIPLYCKSFTFLCNLLHANLYYVTKPDPTNTPEFRHRSRPVHFSGTCYVSLSIDYLRKAAGQEQRSRFSLEMGVGVTSFALPSVLSHMTLLKIMTVKKLVFLLSSEFSILKVLVLKTYKQLQGPQTFKNIKLVLLPLTMSPKSLAELGFAIFLVLMTHQNPLLPPPPFHFLPLFKDCTFSGEIY